MSAPVEMIKISDRWLCRIRVGMLLVASTVWGCNHRPERTSASPLTGHQKCPVLSGVVAEFSLKEDLIKYGENLIIKATYHNVTDQPQVLRRISSLIHHVDLYTESGKEVMLADGYAIPETPYIEIPIASGLSMAEEQPIPFHNKYNAPPGRYYVQMMYDLRLLDAPEPKDPWIQWCNKRIWITIR